MKVILLKDVPKLGKMGDVKQVADGHSLNLLIPKGLVERATPEKLEALEMKMQRLEAAHVKEAENFQKAFLKLKSGIIEIAASANEQGHLFEGVTAQKIADALLHRTGEPFVDSMVELDKPIKEVGERDVRVHIPGDTVTITVKVVAQ